MEWRANLCRFVEFKEITLKTSKKPSKNAENGKNHVFKTIHRFWHGFGM